MSDKPSTEIPQNGGFERSCCYSCCRPATSNPSMFSNSQLAKLEDGIPARCKECISGEMGQSSSSTNLPAKNAKCVYLRGVNRTCTADSIATHFSSIGEIDRIEFQGGGEGTPLLSSYLKSFARNTPSYPTNLHFVHDPYITTGWVYFLTDDAAIRAVRELHHSVLNGTILSVRFEANICPETGKRRQIPSASIPKTITHITNVGKQ